MSHEKFTAALLETSQQPFQISLIHYRAHTWHRHNISKGNDFANRAANDAIQT